MTNSAKDQIYTIKQDKVEDFVFDQKVASVFEDMIQRSVPGYVAVHKLLPLVAKNFIQPNTNVYDLGCSLGEAAFSIADTNQCNDVVIYAVDNSPAMIKQLQERIVNQRPGIRIVPKCEDVVTVDMNEASFVILNYTLQFIETGKRDEFIIRIYTHLLDRGALLLSEKLVYEDAKEEELMQCLHENFKRENEYSELEISQKREALENVLVRDTHEQHMNRLNKAGFSKVFMLAKYLNFITYLAVK